MSGTENADPSTPFLEPVESGDAAAFVEALASSEGRQRFADAREAISGLLAPAAEEFLLQCLELLPQKKALAHLAPLVGGLRPRVAALEPGDRTRALAVALCLAQISCCTAVRVLDKWEVKEGDALPEQARALEWLARELFAAKNWTDLEVFVQRLPGALKMDPERLVGGHAELRIAGNILKVQGRRKQAGKMFAAARQARIEKEVSRGRPIKAVTAASRRKEDQRFFLQLCLAEGMGELAQEVASGWGVPLTLDAEARRQQALRGARHYEFPPGVRIDLVEQEEQLPAAFAALRKSPVVGVDVESSRRGRPLTLQLATRGCAYVLDLLSLGSSARLGTSISELLADGEVLKLGFSMAQDLRSLAKTKAMRSCTSSPRDSQMDLSHLANGTGLAELTSNVLGKPLDKAMQASDWERRPLTPAQKRYAALDAWILTELHSRLQEVAGARVNG